MLAEQRPGLGGDQSPIAKGAKGLIMLKAEDAEHLGLLMIEHRMLRGSFDEALREAIERNPQAIEGLLRNPTGENRYRLGLAAGVLPLDPRIQQVFAPSIQDGVNLEVKTYHNDWILCQDAEDYMDKALKMNALVLVNGSILMKTVGKFTGLCVRSFSTAKSTFLEGNWYSPTDEESREAIKKGFDMGQGHVDLAEGSWVLLRSIYGDKKGQEVLAKSKKAAENFPQHLPLMIRGIPRRKFRVANFEAMK